MKKRAERLEDWSPINDGDVLSFDGLEPTHITVRSFGAAGVYLDGGSSPDLLVGCGDSCEFVVSFDLQMPHQVKFVLESVELPAAIKVRDLRPHLTDIGDRQPFVVIKPKVRQSEEMRVMLQMMRQQQLQFERRLSEIHRAQPSDLDRSTTSGASRVADQVGAARGGVPAGDASDAGGSDQVEPSNGPDPVD